MNSALPGDDWMTRARCVDADPDIFFPALGDNAREAKAVCDACPVREECLEYAVFHEINQGIWGGTNYLERQRIRAARKNVA